MYKIKNNHDGFSMVEVILVLVIIGVAGVLGWMAYKNYRSTGKSPTSVAANKSSEKAQDAVQDPIDPTTDWISYASSDNKLSLKYPKSWVTVTDHPELCGKEILLLAPNASSLGTCGSESFGEIAVQWRRSSQSCDTFGDDNSIKYDDGTVEVTTVNTTKEKVTVVGVNGYKRTGTSTGKGPYSFPEGTETIDYCFNKDGYLYSADYVQKPSFPDVKNNFNTMVTKTLKFGN